MKGLLKFLTGVTVALGPAIFVIWALFYKFAPYVASLIPAGQWHALLAVAVYVAVAIFGGVELVIIAFILGFAVATLIFGK